jgi:hypothetical protein
VVYTLQKQTAKELYINQASGAPNVASPVVSVYQQHSSKILLDFEQYLQQMQSKFEKRKRATQAEFQLKMAEIAAKVRVSGATERLMNTQQGTSVSLFIKMAVQTIYRSIDVCVELFF